MALNVMLYVAFPLFYRYSIRDFTSGYINCFRGENPQKVLFITAYTFQTPLHFTSLFSEHLIRTELGIKQQQKQNIFNALCIKLFY